MDLSEKEVQLLVKFRERVGDILVEDYQKKDYYLIRWIRARDLDLEKAESMLRKANDWRVKNNVDNLINREFAQVYYDKYPYFYQDQFDLEGRPFLIEPMGRWDIRSQVEIEGKEEFVRYSGQMLERILKILRDKQDNPEKYPNPPTQFLVIMDFDKFAYRQLANMKTVESLMEMVGYFEEHYPELLYKTLIINAPRIFSILFNLVKPLVSRKTLGKVTIFGSNRDEWVQEILKFVSPDQLPELYGGSRPTPVQLLEKDKS